jgi:hypothetical protein
MKKFINFKALEAGKSKSMATALSQLSDRV